MNLTITLIVIITTAIITAGVTALALHINTLTNRLRYLEQVQERKRHTHSTHAGLEDAYFVLRRILIERDLENVYLKDAAEALGIVIADPNGYDKDRPSGRRLTRQELEELYERLPKSDQQ